MGDAVKLICKNCGKEIPDGSHYCNICGAEQTEDDIQNEKNDKQIENEIPDVLKENSVIGKARNNTKSPKIAMVLCICIFVLIIALPPLINTFSKAQAVVDSESSSNMDQSSDNSSLDTNSIYTDENNTYQTTDNSETDYGTNLNSDSTDSYNLGGGASEEPVADDEKGACWDLAEKVVTANLKSPSTAKFPFSYGDEGVSFSKSGNLYTVTGWVDAENSYGAELRSNFIVTMTKSGYGSDAEFTSDSCVIN